MISSEYCQTMAEYNLTMNKRLYDVCSQLSDESRTRDVGLFFNSIHRTLEHLLFADMAWLLRFLGRESEVPNMEQVSFINFSDLALSRKNWDQQIVNWSEGISEEWLTDNFSFTSKVYDETKTKKAWVLVVHMFNHSTHHRGQLTTALTQQGFDFGITDLPFVI